MSDMFSLQTVQMTEALATALKTVRTANKVSSADLAYKIKKSASYVTKLERGGIRSVKADVFIDICRFITHASDDMSGIKRVLRTLVHDNDEPDADTYISALNIDDLLIEHQLPSNLIKSMRKNMAEGGISIDQLTDQVNRNENIRLESFYETMPVNIWVKADEDAPYNCSIKFSIPNEYIESLLNGEIPFVHRAIMEGILFALYTLAKIEEPRNTAMSKLNAERICPTIQSKFIEITDSNVGTLFDGIEPATLEIIQDIVVQLKILAGLSPDHGFKGMNQINTNFHSDLGFFYAIMRTDFSGLSEKSRAQKKGFLKDLRELVVKYSNEETGIDMYD